MRRHAIVLTVLFSFWAPTWWEQPRVLSVGPAVIEFPDPGFPMPNPEDVSIFEQKLQSSEGAGGLADQTLAVALSFSGTPYVKGTLNTDAGEQLVVNLRELDCWTFMENSLAIALTAQASEPAFDTLQHYVQQLRYWGGRINGYASRIHYFTGWLMQAEKLGYLTDLTQALGGIPYPKKITYMSARPQKYPALLDRDTRHTLQQVEDRLNRHHWYFIPQNRIAGMEHLLRDGDIVALTSAKRDLDIAHQGFAIRKNGRVHLLHASSLHKRVVLSTQPLADYVVDQPGQTGIMVARLK